MIPNLVKNRQRDPFSFANINLLGRCNIDCFFCLGKDIPGLLNQHNQLHTHFRGWERFEEFLDRCRKYGIKKIYITGQNTDSLLYDYLDELVSYLMKAGFQVGLRTNGYRLVFPTQFNELMPVINRCELSTGYSIHTLDPVVSKMIVGRQDIPPWSVILGRTLRPRVSIVINRCNEHEFFSIVSRLSLYDAGTRHIRYVQARRVSTETRVPQLAPDIAAYERIYTIVSEAFPLKNKIFGDAEVYEMHGLDVVFWRTIKTTANSINYFTDGTISDEYFIVEGYCKQHVGEPQK